MTAVGPDGVRRSEPPVLPMSTWGALWLVELSGTSESYWSQLRSKGRMKVTDLVSRPGRIHARVVDRRGEVHPVDIEVRHLSSGERDDVVATVGRRSGTLAALLDGSVPSVLVEEVAELEINLFPGPSDLRISCRCDEWTDPCPHASAVLRTLADSIDRDPFKLFELRGLPRSDLLGALRRQRCSTTVAQSDRPGFDPWAGWTIDRIVPEPTAPVSWAISEMEHDHDDPGDSGFVLTSDPVLAEQIRAARHEAIGRARLLLTQWTERRPGQGDET